MNKSRRPENASYALCLVSSFNYRSTFKYFESEYAALEYFKEIEGNPVRLNRYETIDLIDFTQGQTKYGAWDRLYSMH